VERRGATEIEEFKLTKPVKLGTIQPETKQEPFKALELNKKILEQQTFKPKFSASKRTVSPFKFHTEDRLHNQKQEDQEKENY